jgi:hypothetical protein
MYGVPAWVWFDLAALVTAIGLTVLLLRHVRRPLAVVPSTPLGQGQALYLLLLAIMVIGNFERALVGFADQRLVTEGVLHVNAVICAVSLLIAPAGGEPADPVVAAPAQPREAGWRRLVLVGTAAALATIVLDWAIVRAIYGDRFAGHAGLHIRFGPNATIHSSTGAAR